MSSDPLVMKLIEENKALALRLDDAEKQAEYNGNAARSVALRLADAESRLGDRERQVEFLTADRDNEQKMRISLSSRLDSALALIAQARDALHPAVSPVTRARLDEFLAGARRETHELEIQTAVLDWAPPLDLRQRGHQ